MGPRREVPKSKRLDRLPLSLCPLARDPGDTLPQAPPSIPPPQLSTFSGPNTIHSPASSLCSDTSCKTPRDEEVARPIQSHSLTLPVRTRTQDSRCPSLPSPLLIPILPGPPGHPNSLINHLWVQRCRSPSQTGGGSPPRTPDPHRRPLPLCPPTLRQIWDFHLEPRGGLP